MSSDDSDCLVSHAIHHYSKFGDVALYFHRILLTLGVFVGYKVPVSSDLEEVVWKYFSEAFDCFIIILLEMVSDVGSL